MDLGNFSSQFSEIGTRVLKNLNVRMYRFCYANWYCTFRIRSILSLLGWKYSKAKREEVSETVKTNLIHLYTHLVYYMVLLSDLSVEFEQVCLRCFAHLFTFSSTMFSNSQTLLKHASQFLSFPSMFL